ncbi:unnamed protein product, partial [Closterium sp. NIES-54]
QAAKAASAMSPLGRLRCQTYRVAASMKVIVCCAGVGGSSLTMTGVVVPAAADVVSAAANVVSAAADVVSVAAVC